MTTTTKKTAHEADDGVSELLHEAGDRIIALKDEYSTTLGKQIDELGKTMKKHPVLAIGIGLGAGYILARIIHRS